MNPKLNQYNQDCLFVIIIMTNGIGRNFKIENEEIRRVEKFIYMGSIITSWEDALEHVQDSKVCKVETANYYKQLFTQLKNIWSERYSLRNKSMDLKPKK